MRRKTALITGASDGIGLALARLFQAEGARVVGVGRRPPAELERELRGDYCRVDLAQPFAAAVVAEFLRRRGVDELDLLIHCAGVGSYGPVEAQAAGAIDALLDTNLRAPVALTHALLPALAAVAGRVVFIGSVAAALPVPDYAVYGATKAALEGFARGLRVELRGRAGVQVIHPGATRTGMHAKVGAPLERMGWRRFPPPERVARQIARAIAGGAPVATVGLGNRLLRLAGRHLGGLVDRAAAARAGGSPAPARPRHCVVTGGADGIGRAVAERFARAGYAVTILDRDAERAAEVCEAIRAAGEGATVIATDLARPEGVALALRRLAVLRPADVVVHSAGISAVGRFAEGEIARQLAVLDVNLRAPAQLTAGALRAGLVTPGGTLVYIASLSVFTGYPGAAVYAASKDGLAAYARSLRAALAGRGVHVLTVYPGPTRTAHARRYSPDNRREGRRMPPERLAGLIFDAVERRGVALIPGFANRLIAAVGRLAPALTEELMRRTILD
ncbi:MAG TPA: SDR family NAD(P)-dependent oxidoreductase, partial [Chloroflexaceae bacterium]|nr:SDR family NAD(P)-dependent oxidoreductase [Chloroflexaceae bacterium]